jgi:hypothetical protein
MIPARDKGLADRADALIRALGRLGEAQERGAGSDEVEALTRQVVEAQGDLIAARQAVAGPDLSG